MSHNHSQKLTVAGLLVTLGIIYGDIGTSPLYVMKAILGNEIITRELVLGGISCVFWTLTLQTTIKYVLFTLQADNKGEGGIFALYTLVRRRKKWLYIPAIVGGAALLADGIITPPISVSSAIEGLQIIYPELKTIPIVIAIITALFFFQRFGTSVVGKTFGPIMMVWFSMLAVLGINQIIQMPWVLKAVNPHYAYQLLAEHPGGFWLLGAVFLCTTGAEALYSDLGHCGLQNVRVSWVFVKTCLLLNYFGQGAWILSGEGTRLSGNPFYSVMPEWFLPIGIGVATMAAIIASQALISGSFTLISEAVRLNFWPKLRIVYPTLEKGQLYVPAINIMLWLGCIGIILYFKESAHMEAAYGLSITITMMMTTILLMYFLLKMKYSRLLVGFLLVLYISIEVSFLVANLTKFSEGGYVTIILGGLISLVMYTWLEANKIKKRLTEYVSLRPYVEPLSQLSNDISVPKYATNLVFMTGADKLDQVETKIIHSIFFRQPKRADVYWFVHVDTVDEPYTMEYKVDILAPDTVIKITFILGFKVEQRINLFFRKVVEDMVKKGEVDITSRYASLNKQNFTGDFRFVVLEKFLSFENDLPFKEQLVMDGYFSLKKYSMDERKWFGLDTSLVTVEKVPLIIRPVEEINLHRIND